MPEYPLPRPPSLWKQSERELVGVDVGHVAEVADVELVGGRGGVVDAGL